MWESGEQGKVYLEELWFRLAAYMDRILVQACIPSLHTSPFLLPPPSRCASHLSSSPSPFPPHPMPATPPLQLPSSSLCFSPSPVSLSLLLPISRTCAAAPQSPLLRLSEKCLGRRERGSKGQTVSCPRCNSCSRTWWSLSPTCSWSSMSYPTRLCRSPHLPKLCSLPTSPSFPALHFRVPYIRFRHPCSRPLPSCFTA